jgi:hypothetical protein
MLKRSLPIAVVAFLLTASVSVAYTICGAWGACHICTFWSDTGVYQGYAGWGCVQ